LPALYPVYVHGLLLNSSIKNVFLNHGVDRLAIHRRQRIMPRDLESFYVEGGMSASTR